MKRFAISAALIVLLAATARAELRRADIAIFGMD